MVRRLPRRQREIVVLRYLLDLREREIAEVLGIRRGTVSRSLAAAHETLRGWLSDDEQAPRMSELSRLGMRLIEHPALAAPPPELIQDRATRYRRRRLRAQVTACAVAVAVVAGGVMAGTVLASPAPFAQAGVLPAPRVASVPATQDHAPVSAGDWALTSYISEPAAWSRGNTGPAAGGYLSVPAGTDVLLRGLIRNSRYFP